MFAITVCSRFLTWPTRIHDARSDLGISRRNRITPKRACADIIPKNRLLGGLRGGSPERRATHRHHAADGFAAPAARQAIETAALAPTERLQNGGQGPQRAEVRIGWGATNSTRVATRPRAVGRQPSTRPGAGQHGCRRHGGTETRLSLATLRARPLARGEGQARQSAQEETPGPARACRYAPITE